MNNGKKIILDDNCAFNDFSDSALAQNAILAFCNSELVYDNDSRYENSFYGRRLRPHILKYLNFSQPLTKDELLSYQAFAANRVLYAMNELDFLMLPQTEELERKDFYEFYSDNRQSASAVGRPYLEKYLFNILENEIVIDGTWTCSRTRDYFQSQLDKNENCYEESSLVRAIRNSRNPKNALLDFLIQLAPDFIVESSPMSRYAGGSYGGLSSSLFKIIIDELGYGHHPTRHSTLYENTLTSAELDATPHRYWQYYLNSSLALANYYNMITRDKRNIFRYIGAIYQAETGFITACEEWRNCIRDIAPEIDLRYFDEHCHIDKDHSQMALETLVYPAIEKYGPKAAKEIVRGYEEATWLGKIFELDFHKQISWKDNADYYKKLYRKIIAPVSEAHKSGSLTMGQFVEPTGELSITHTHDEDELCHIVSGTMEFLNGFEKSTILGPGEGIVIEKNRLHGALIEHGPCTYQIYNIEDSEKWP